jgi:hypothetical protein
VTGRRSRDNRRARSGERLAPVLFRVAAACAAVLVAAITGITAVPGVPDAAPAPVTPATSHVIVVGVTGLRWDDVGPTRTPTLWRLIREGSAGALSVRAAGPLTCAADGWVTLGAGNRARGPAHGNGCPSALPLQSPVTTRDSGARLPEQSEITARNTELAQGARPGALADGVRCVTAVGSGAALAAAHPSGRIDRYTPTLPADPTDLLSRCPVTLVEGAAVDGVTTTSRQLAAKTADATLAAVDAARPAGSVLLVVGVADTGNPPRLHVALAVGPGFKAGAELRSPTTDRTPFVQLVDIAPTAIAALGLTAVPTMTGVAVETAAGTANSAVDPARRIKAMVDQDRAAGAQRPLVQPFFTVMVVADILLLLAVTRFVFARWNHVLTSSVSRPGFRWPGAVEALEVLAIGLASVPVAAFAANLLPWWRSPAPGLTVWSLILAGATALASLAYGGPWRRRPTGPVGCVAVVTALVLALDVLGGSSLQLDALPGYSPLVAGRFTGFGNLAFGVYAAGVLLGLGCLAQAVPGWRRPALFTVAGAFSVLIVGASSWGADVGGILALTPAVLLAAVRLAGRRVSLGVLAGAGVAALGTVSAFAAADYARPAEKRSHLGRFVAQLFDGSAGTVIHRKAEANVTLLLTSQLTLLMLAVLIFVPVVLLMPTGRLRRVLGLYPAVRAGLIGLAVAATIGFVVNDSGVAVPAFAAMVAVPLVIALTIRVALAGQRPPPKASGDPSIFSTTSAAVPSGGSGAGKPEADEEPADRTETPRPPAPRAPAGAAEATA